MKRMCNILELTLSALSVKHTKTFVKKIYQEDPDRNNFQGLSRMLSLFGVFSSGYTCVDYHLLFAEHDPFIVAVNNSFSLVLSIDEQNITIRTSNTTRTIATATFFMNTVDAVLLLKKSDHACEPNFKDHIKYERAEIIKKQAITISLCILLGFKMHTLSGIYGIGEWLFISLNVVALVLCGLLLEKQVYGKSPVGDKICMTFKIQGCNSVLGSTAAKPFLSLTWSELGFGFFGVNTIIALLEPNKISSLVLICLCSVIVSIWSFLYQLIRKKWCPLCVLIQSCVLLQCAVILCYKMIPSFPPHLYSYVFILFYPIVIISIHFMARFSRNNRIREETIQRLYPIVTDSNVFNYQLKQQQYISVSNNDSSIIIGNLDAPNTLTIFISLHCLPCAETHKMISSLLNRLDSYRIQYIFAVFNYELERDSKTLVSCLLNSNGSYETLLDEWFRDGMNNPNCFINTHGGIHCDISANEEIEKHKKWATNSGLQATPTLLLNGYVLPQEYSIKDLVYITCEE